MMLASAADFPDIMRAFAAHRDVFPHIRNDYVRRRIASNQCYWEDGVAITFSKYKRAQRLGTYRAMKGDTALHQIVTVEQGSGDAARLMRDFLMIHAPVVLTVRAENNRARAFYLKLGMKHVGSITWANGKIPGCVYRYE